MQSDAVGVVLLPSLAGLPLGVMVEVQRELTCSAHMEMVK